jgi:chromosome segregation ATPase
MDPELVAFLEERFSRLERSSSEFREETLSRFDRVDERLDQMDRRFDQMDGRLDQMDGRLDRVETEGRHTRILVEDLRGMISLLAEGVIGLGERMENFEERILKKEFKEVRDLMRPAYSELDRRVRALETWRETKERDPIEIIREWKAQGRFDVPRKEE